MHVASILQLQVLAFVNIVCMTFALPHMGHWSFLAPSQCPFMLRIFVFWNMMLCYWDSSSLCLKWEHCLHPLGSSGPWRWFFMDHLTCEDEGNTFFWNARNLSYNDAVSFSRGPESLIIFLWKIWNLHLHHVLQFPLNFIAVCNCISACDENEEWSTCMVPCSQVCLYYDFVLKENGLCSNVEDCVQGKWV